MIHASKKEKTCSKILIACLRLLNPLVKIYFSQGSHSPWNSWKNEKAYSSPGKSWKTCPHP